MNRVFYSFVGVLSFLTLAVALVLIGSPISADVIDDVIITVPAACTLNQVVDVAHVDTIQNGHLENDIGTTTFTVYCNDSAGFAIYAIGYSGDEYGGTDLIASNSNNPNIATGLTTSGTPSAWAMKLIPVTGTYTPTIENGFNSYKAVPTTYTKVASFNTLNDASIGSSIQSTYRVFAASGQAADTYTGKVRYTLVHPASEVPTQPQATDPGKICYYANASDAVGTMGCQTIGTTEGTTSTSATLLASNFSRTGYGFAGWSDAFDYASNSNAHFYGPQEDITFTEGQYGGNNPGLSLYAVWVESAGSLQDSAKVATLCGTGTGSLVTAPTNGTANLSSVSALTDLRDNQAYAIAKLADGKCWMIENLRLESTNSDNRTGALAQGYGGQFEGLATAEPAWANSIITANSLYSTDGANNTINIGTSNAANRFPRYNHDNTNSRASNPTANTEAMYSYGNYYTWAAAIADTTHYADNNQSVTNTSICPSSWHLPSGGDKNNFASSEFWILSRATIGADPANYESSTRPSYSDTPEGTEASNKMRSYPLNFVYSGTILAGSAINRSSHGYYLSSTVYSSSYVYYLSLGSSTVAPGTSYVGSKYGGRSVRCVASNS